MFDTAGILIAIGAAVLTLIAFITYFMSTREEGEFDKVYNSGALALLTESDKKEKKQKNKKENKKNKQQQPNQPQNQQAAQNSSQSQKDDTEDEADDVKEVVHEKKHEKVTQNAAPAVPKQQTPPKDSPPKAKESPKDQQQPKKKPSKPVNVKDLDQKKVLARLSAVADLEEGYVQYLTTCFRDSEQLKNNLSSEVKALHKKLTDAAQKSEKLVKEKNNVEQREKQEQNKQVTLSAKIQSLQALQNECAEKLRAAQDQLRQRDEQIAKEAQSQRNRHQQMDNEIHSLRANNTKLVGQIKSLQSQVAAAPSPAETVSSRAQIHELTERLHKFEKVVAEMESSYDKKVGDFLALSQEASNMEKAIKGLEEELAASRRDLAAQAAREAQKDEEKSKLEQEKVRMDEEYQKLKHLVEELNKDVAEFHDYKKEQEAIVSAQQKREESREIEVAREKAEFEAKEQALTQQIVIEKIKLAQAEAALEAEKARVVEIPANNAAPEPVVEEVFELKKTNTDLAAAPSVSGPSEAEIELKKENARLQEKNDELRQRNYNLLEKSEEAPKRTINERKRVVEHVSKVTKKAFKAFDDEEAYIGFVEESLSGVAKEIAECRATPAAAPAPVVKAAPTPAPTPVNNTNDSVYRTALEELAARLESIGELAEQQERKHQEELAQLRKVKA